MQDKYAYTSRRLDSQEETTSGEFGRFFTYLISTWSNNGKYVIIGAKYEIWHHKMEEAAQISIFIYIPPQINESIGHKKLHLVNLADF